MSKSQNLVLLVPFGGQFLLAYSNPPALQRKEICDKNAVAVVNSKTFSFRWGFFPPDCKLADQQATLSLPFVMG